MGGYQEPLDIDQISFDLMFTVTQAPMDSGDEANSAVRGGRTREIQEGMADIGKWRKTVGGESRGKW